MTDLADLGALIAKYSATLSQIEKLKEAGELPLVTDEATEGLRILLLLAQAVRDWKRHGITDDEIRQEFQDLLKQRRNL